MDKKWIRKRQLAQRAADSALAPPEAALKIKNYLTAAQLGTYFVNFSVFPMVFFAHKKKYFARKSPYYIKEVGMVLGLFGYMKLAEFGIYAGCWAMMENDVKDVQKRWKEVSKEQKSLVKDRFNQEEVNFESGLAKEDD